MARWPFAAHDGVAAPTGALDCVSAPPQYEHTHRGASWDADVDGAHQADLGRLEQMAILRCQRIPVFVIQRHLRSEMSGRSSLGAQIAQFRAHRRAPLQQPACRSYRGTARGCHCWVDHAPRSASARTSSASARRALFTVGLSRVCGAYSGAAIRRGGAVAADATSACSRCSRPSLRWRRIG